MDTSEFKKIPEFLVGEQRIVNLVVFFFIFFCKHQGADIIWFGLSITNESDLNVCE